MPADCVKKKIAAGIKPKEAHRLCYKKKGNPSKKSKPAY